jgi:hypothetical protein
MAVVFPAPAGAIASCSRAPEVHICRDKGRLTRIQGGAVRGHLQQGDVDCGAVEDSSVADAGDGDEALLGVEDALRGVDVGASDGVNRRPVDPPQRAWFFDAVRWCGQRY